MSCQPVRFLTQFTYEELNNSWCFLFGGRLKIAFKAKTSEFIASKAEGRNRPEAMLFIVEDLFWPDNVAGGERSRLQAK